MSANSTAKSIVKALLGVGAVGAGSLAYAGLYEVNAFRLRRVTVPVLPRGARPIRVLHVSDVHMTPYARPAALAVHSGRTGAGSGDQHRRQPRA